MGVAKGGGGGNTPIHHGLGKCLLDTANVFGFIGKLFSWSAKIFEWFGIKSNSYSKRFVKFTKITETGPRLLCLHRVS